MDPPQANGVFGIPISITVCFCLCLCLLCFGFGFVLFCFVRNSLYTWPMMMMMQIFAYIKANSAHLGWLAEQ